MRGRNQTGTTGQRLHERKERNVHYSLRSTPLSAKRFEHVRDDERDTVKKR